MIRDYYNLTKPGIIYGNAITAIAGFFLAEKGRFNLQLFLAMLIGLSLIIGSACVFNNIWDAGIDAKMQRTKTRAMASGSISKTSAFVYGTILLIIGISMFLYFSISLSLYISLLGFLSYVFLYTPLKRKTSFATIIGALPGAIPPVVGYTAVTNHIDLAAILLFAILFFWQMPHFYAIAIRRLDEYKAASIPILPLKIGIKNTKLHIICYIIVFIIIALLLSYFKFTGYTYSALVIILGLMWLFKAAKGFNTKDDTLWAKKVFLFSLITLTTLSAALALNVVLP